MSKDKAFLDTTILTDILLKPSDKGKIAKAALLNFKETLLPVYAIKEFKAGPLSNFKWFHNKLAVNASFFQSIAALQRMSLSPKRYTTATALEALKEASAELASVTNSDLKKRYGAKASVDKTLCDIFRLSIKTAIIKGWKRRNSIATKTVQDLSCYKQIDPFEKKGLIELQPTKCSYEKECCLAPSLRKRLDDLDLLQKKIEELPDKSENQKRRKILHEIFRKPKQKITEDNCRGLGDAYFAIFCPEDADILTTNINDHLPLANALGKSAITPDEINKSA